MTLHVLPPTGGPDVTRRNKRSILYITTDDTAAIGADTDPDGSIRIVFTPGDLSAHIEAKANGVYNDTGFRFSSSSVNIGRDLQASAVGGFLETLNLSEIDDHLKALIPHIQFDVNGTLGAAHTPILDVRKDFFVFPGPATGEINSTVIGQVFIATPTRVLHSATHLVGSLSSTAPVEVSYYKGTTNTGPLLNRLNLSPSSMVANTPLVIVYDSDFGFENATNIFFEFKSNGNMTLETNSGGNVITTQNGHELEELDNILDEFVLANDLRITFDNNLNVVVHNRFPL